MIKEIYIDQDGVMANCVKAMLDIHSWDSPWPTPPIHHDCHEWWEDTRKMSMADFWKPIDQDGKFWANISPYGWLDELLIACAQAVGKENLFVLTSPHQHANCYYGKVEWLEEYVPVVPKSQYIFCKQKGKLGSEGRLLIDDKNENIDDFKAEGGEGLLFPQPWNRNWAVGDSMRMQYVKRELELLMEEYE